MGLPMQDIHAPTIEAGPTGQARHLDNGDDSKLNLADLMARKDGAEAEMIALGSVLESVSKWGSFDTY